MDCITKLAVEECGCRNIYMPSVYGIGFFLLVFHPLIQYFTIL